MIEEEWRENFDAFGDLLRFVFMGAIAEYPATHALHKYTAGAFENCIVEFAPNK